jgi:sulfur-carrier protein
MHITVKLFAILRDRAGIGETSLELSTGTTALQAAQQLLAAYPSIDPFISRLAFAVNEEYVPANTLLNDGDELALIPPVSGG